MPQYLDITNWSIQPYFSTKGTRDKSVLLSPAGEQYYFKTSIYKPGKDFKYEFWSEIIAYEVGSSLGFNVLKYDVGFSKTKIGCICKSMIERKNEILTEGVQYLQGYDPNFAAGESKGGKAYSYQLIYNSLAKFRLQDFQDQLIEIIIFDAIIGNGDRHQENWAFITDHTALQKTFVDFVRDLRKLVRNKRAWMAAPKIFRLLIRKLYFKSTSREFRDEVLFANFTWNKNIRFAPIYDSGSSLGRELNEQRVAELLRNQEALHRYLDNGLSEIHWDGVKLTHFQLIQKVLEEVPSKRTRIQQLVQSYSELMVHDILQKIDHELPEQFVHVKMPVERKGINQEAYYFTDRKT
jgi:hypothetical protein